MKRQSLYRYTRLCSVGSLLFFTHCGFGTKSYLEADPHSLPPSINYVDHIKPRIDYYCGACHSPDALGGLSADVDFSTYEAVALNVDVIEYYAFEERSMPPGTARKMEFYDLAILKAWQAHGAPECDRDTQCEGGHTCGPDRSTKEQTIRCIPNE